MNYELTDYVKVFEDVLTSDQCDLAIKYFDDNEEELATNGMVSSSNGEPRIDKSIKSVMQMPMCGNSELDAIFEESCSNILNYYVNSINFYPYSAFNDTGYDMKKYYKDDNFYKWHIDACKPEHLNRILAIVWYLNDVEEGGETEFKNGIKVSPKRGKALVFPTNFCFPHQANVPITTAKYSVDTFIVGL